MNTVQAHQNSSYLHDVVGAMPTEWSINIFGAVVLCIAGALLYGIFAHQNTKRSQAVASATLGVLAVAGTMSLLMPYSTVDQAALNTTVAQQYNYVSAHPSTVNTTMTPNIGVDELTSGIPYVGETKSGEYETFVITGDGSSVSKVTA